VARNERKEKKKEARRLKKEADKKRTEKSKRVSSDPDFDIEDDEMGMETTNTAKRRQRTTT